MFERIVVIGIGRIGLCLALNLEKAGYGVLGIDKNAEHVRQIREKIFRTSEPGVEAALRAARNLQVAEDISQIPSFDPEVIFLAVDTPAAEKEGYDQRNLDAALAALFRLDSWRPRVELSLVCTTFPGFCDSKADTARKFGYALSYTPAFIAQGSILRDQKFPDQILIGQADTEAGEKLERIFRGLCANTPSVHRMKPLSAEIAKLATNCALTMKIAFANAVGDLAGSCGAEPEQILAAIGADTRIGSKFLQYGFGYGGPCLSRDNRALQLFAERHHYELLQAGATDTMNRKHLQFQVTEYLRACPEDEPIHFWFVTYKPDTEILEESQPLLLALELARSGRTIVIHESPAVVTGLRSQFGDLFVYQERCEDREKPFKPKNW